MKKQSVMEFPFEAASDSVTKSTALRDILAKFPPVPMQVNSHPQFNPMKSPSMPRF